MLKVMPEKSKNDLKMDIYNLSEIETELRLTADAACANGINALLETQKITIEELLSNREKYNGDFIRHCHDGFKIAQNRIIKNILLIQDEQELIKERLKQARIIKDKKETSELIKKGKHLENISVLFKHCADALVWQLIQGQLWISRRLYLKVGGQKKLKDVNLKSAIMVADQINSNPMNFVLITDVTNNVQVGDLVGFIDGAFVITEIKEGEKNFEVLEIIKELSNNTITAKDVADNFASEPKFLEQLSRTLKQHQVLHDVHQILSTDKGIDPTSKKEIKIITPQEPTPTYIARLAALEDQLKERNFWAYDVIEDCLHIGIYKGEKRFGGHLILKAICEQDNKLNYVIVDILRVLESLNKPIFFLPFSPDFIFDLIFGRIKMYFMLDLDGYIELYKQYDLTAQWASKKETAKMNEFAKDYDIFKHKDRGIKIISSRYTNVDMWLSYGTLTRIFFEHNYPSYTAYTTHYYLNQK